MRRRPQRDAVRSDIQPEGQDTASGTIRRGNDERAVVDECSVSAECRRAYSISPLGLRDSLSAKLAMWAPTMAEWVQTVWFEDHTVAADRGRLC
jgi:hypothetical protein